MLHAVSGQVLLVHDLVADSLPKGGKGDKGLVTDHPGQGQPQVGSGTVVVVAALKVRVGDDGEHLLEIVDQLQDGDFQARRDRYHHLHPIGVAGAHHHRHQATH